MMRKAGPAMATQRLFKMMVYVKTQSEISLEPLAILTHQQSRNKLINSVFKDSGLDENLSKRMQVYRTRESALKNSKTYSIGTPALKKKNSCRNERFHDQKRKAESEGQRLIDEKHHAHYETCKGSVNEILTEKWIYIRNDWNKSHVKKQQHGSVTLQR